MKFIDYEMTGEKLVFLTDDKPAKRQEVQKGTAQAEALFEEVAKNRDLAGLNGDEAKEAREAAEAAKSEPKEEEQQSSEQGAEGGSGTATGAGVEPTPKDIAAKEAAEKEAADKATTDEQAVKAAEAAKASASAEGEGAGTGTSEAKVGDVCTTEDGKPGTMQPNGEGQPLVCVADAPKA